ncbi:MAG: hypothetical protein SFU27_03135, partial [Thermonemataceae bacterium]|nr:hypothetical protein [Thermonemataceae bacterium]
LVRGVSFSVIVYVSVFFGSSCVECVELLGYVLETTMGIDLIQKRSKTLINIRKTWSTVVILIC